MQRQRRKFNANFINIPDLLKTIQKRANKFYTKCLNKIRYSVVAIFIRFSSDFVFSNRV